MDQGYSCPYVALRSVKEQCKQCNELEWLLWFKNCLREKSPLKLKSNDKTSCQFYQALYILLKHSHKVSVRGLPAKNKAIYGYSLIATGRNAPIPLFLLFRASTSTCGYLLMPRTKIVLKYHYSLTMTLKTCFISIRGPLLSVNKLHLQHDAAADIWTFNSEVSWTNTALPLRSLPHNLQHTQWISGPHNKQLKQQPFTFQSTAERDLRDLWARGKPHFVNYPPALQWFVFQRSCGLCMVRLELNGWTRCCTAHLLSHQTHCPACCWPGPRVAFWQVAQIFLLVCLSSRHPPQLQHHHLLGPIAVLMFEKNKTMLNYL